MVSAHAVMEDLGRALLSPSAHSCPTCSPPTLQRGKLNECNASGFFFTCLTTMHPHHDPPVLRGVTVVIPSFGGPGKLNTWVNSVRTRKQSFLAVSRNYASRLEPYICVWIHELAVQLFMKEKHVLWRHVPPNSCYTPRLKDRRYSWNYRARLLIETT